MNTSAKLHFDSLDKAKLSKLVIALLRIQSGQVNNNANNHFQVKFHKVQTKINRKIPKRRNMWSEIIICADINIIHYWSNTESLTVGTYSTRCDHQATLEWGYQKSGCLLVGFFNYLNQTCCRRQHNF